MTVRERHPLDARMVVAACEQIIEKAYAAMYHIRGGNSTAVEITLREIEAKIKVAREHNGGPVT